MPRLTTRVRPTGPPGYSETLPREPESAVLARRLVRTSCCAWGLHTLAADGAVIITELVANSVRHARRESIRVTVERPAECRVGLGVVDFSKARPVRGTAGPEDETGRGLVLVEALAAEWGTELLPWGKRVWAELGGGEGEGWCPGRRCGNACGYPASRHVNTHPRDPPAPR